MSELQVPRMEKKGKGRTKWVGGQIYSQQEGL